MISRLSYDIAIIGGGLASLTVALSLHQGNIHCTIYEARLEKASNPGALMLSHNSTCIFDGLNIYSEICADGLNLKTVALKYEREEPTDSCQLGSATQKGYNYLRKYQQILFALRAAATRAAIPLHYYHKLAYIAIEDPNTSTVTFTFADGRVGLRS